MECDFYIKRSKSVIGLGNALTIQRKGGDCGNPSSNQIQAKLIFSKLDVKHMSYSLEK